MSRFVVIGAGAIGVTLAAELQQADHEVALVARGVQLELARSSGLTYVRPDGERKLTVPVYAGPHQLALRADDVLVLATKTQDVQHTLAEWARQPVKGDADDRLAGSVLALLTTQNGLETERIASRYFETVIGGVLGVPASFVEPGVVVSAASPRVGAAWLGSYPSGTSAAAELTAAALSDANFEVQVVTEIGQYKNAKLLTSVTFAVQALFAASPLRDRLQELVRSEARSVLHACGERTATLFAAGEPGFSVQQIPGQPYAGNSTSQSLQRAASVETDFLNGEIVLHARLHGLKAPANLALVEAVHRAQTAELAAAPLLDADILRLFPQLEDQMSAQDVLISSDQLRQQLSGPRPPLVLDVRWKLGDPDGRRHYESAHIPGAVYVDLDTELAAPPTPKAGRHPLPSIADLQQAARRWGLDDHRPVVVYDDNGGLSAARAWWLLRWAGVGDVKILDGALAGWRQRVGTLESGAVTPNVGTVSLSAGHMPVLDADGAARIASDGLLLDARAPERYRGESEPVDPRAGHIPGAVSAPAAGSLDEDGGFLDPQALKLHFSDLGAAPNRSVGVYCGSGVTAAHLAAALEIAGVQASLFPGSWSAWSSDPDRPAAAGPTPN